MSISRNFAELTKGTGVTVNAVLPGSTRTEGVREFVQNLFPELPYEQAEARFMAENRSTSLLARLIDPDEIASVVAFVASSRSGAINGASLRADGGDRADGLLTAAAGLICQFGTETGKSDQAWPS